MTRKHAYLILALNVAISSFFGYHVSQLTFKYDFELFHPHGDEATEFFNRYRETFESDNDFILTGIRNESGVFEQAFLTQLEQFTDSLTQLPHVTEVISLTSIKEYKVLPLYPGVYERPYIRIDKPEGYERDSANLVANREWVNSLISPDAKTTSLVIHHTPFLDQDGCFELSEQVQALLATYPFDEGHVVGRCIGLHTYVGLIRKEVALFVGSSVFLIILFLFLSYRTFWGIWMPVSVVGLTVLWTMGWMSFSGKPMDLISNIIPTMLMVIGISNVIHLLTIFIHHLRQGMAKNEALLTAMKEVGRATIFTSLTTIIGFLTLTTSGVRPVIDLGLFSSAGLLIAFLLTYTLFPSLILLNNKVDRPNGTDKGTFWQRHLEGLFNVLLRKKNMLILASTGLVIIALFGASQLRVNSFLMDGMQEDHPRRKAFQFFEDYLSGARPFEMYVTSADTSDLLSLEAIRELDALHGYLDSVYGVGVIRSPHSIIAKANQVLHGGKVAYNRIPTSASELNKILRELDRSKARKEMEKYLTEDRTAMRIQGKIPDRGSVFLEPKNEDLEAFFSETYGSDYSFRLTGAAVMMDNTHRYIVRNVLQGLLIAMVIIGFIMGFLFKSVRIVFFSLLVNLIPLIMTAGVMGYMGIDLRLSTSIIFIIAFGIAVDDSIHFLSKFNREVRRQGSVEEAVRASFLTTGKAIVVTTLIVSGGFLTLCLSDFLGTFYIGILISLTLIFAVIADLVLLPALLLKFYRK